MSLVDDIFHHILRDRDAHIQATGLAPSRVLLMPPAMLQEFLCEFSALSPGALELRDGSEVGFMGVPMIPCADIEQMILVEQAPYGPLTQRVLPDVRRLNNLLALPTGVQRRPSHPRFVAFAPMAAELQVPSPWDDAPLAGGGPVRFEDPPDTPLEEWNAGVDALLAECEAHQDVWEVPE